MAAMDHNAADHDWESCRECVEQAKRDEILGPDAEPFGIHQNGQTRLEVSGEQRELLPIADELIPTDGGDRSAADLELERRRA
jgi:hypothetical protein